MHLEPGKITVSASPHLRQKDQNNIPTVSPDRAGFAKNAPGVHLLQRVLPGRLLAVPLVHAADCCGGPGVRAVLAQGVKNALTGEISYRDFEGCQKYLRLPEPPL